MVENYKIYDLILQSNASKQEWVLKGLRDVSPTPLYHQFDNFQMPDNAPNGEYFYVLVWDIRDDVEYEFDDDILETIVKTNEGTIRLRDLQPQIGLMKYNCEAETNNKYNKKNTGYLYYDRK